MFKEILHNLYEMSNLSPEKSGLKEVIWFSVKGDTKHGPRIKVYKNKKPQGENFSVTIEDNPKTIGKVFVNSKELQKIFELVKVNKDILLKHWNYEIFSDEVIQNLIKV